MNGCTAVFSVVRVGAGVYALFYDQGSGGISATLLCDVCRSNLLFICLPAGTKRFKSAAGDHITEFLRADCAFSAECGSAEQCLPSIHVSSTVAVHLTICHAASVRNKKPIRTLSWIVTILICLSTMFIKQHSLVDVLCGWILSLILDEAVNVWVLVKAFSKGKAGKTTNAVHEE